jgi:hypothetical protein
MRWSAAVLIVIMIVMVVLAVDHDAVVSMPVALTAANPDAIDSDMDVFRDDDRVIAAGVHRTGKCRHRQQRNETKNKHGIFDILHGTLFGRGRSVSR